MDTSHLGGEGLARGYLRRPELTAEKFIPNPFAGEPGSRLYRTGDIVRYLPDGNMEFLGRSDEQVKIRGFRIELGEVQAILNDTPGVSQSVVLVREDVTGAKRLVAYLVGTQEQTMSVSELRHSLQEKLPKYMVPSRFIFLDTLPLTSSGKIDYRALPAPDRTDLTYGLYVPPRNSVEQVLAKIWAELLGVERVGIHDNFFELGGHSLLAIQMIASVRRALT